MYVSFSRDTGILKFAILKAKVIKVRKIEKEMAESDTRKTQEFLKNRIFCNVYDLSEIS